MVIEASNRIQSRVSSDPTRRQPRVDAGFGSGRRSFEGPQGFAEFHIVPHVGQAVTHLQLGAAILLTFTYKERSRKSYKLGEYVYVPLDTYGL